MSNEDEFFAEMHPQIAQVIGIAVMQLLVEKREPSREALPILSVMKTALSIISGSTRTSGGIWNELSFLRLHGAPEVHRALGADAEFHP